MTFAAMATWQAWLVIAIVIAVAVAVFLIKIRPPQILVPSLTLWSRVLDETRDRTLWERIRKAVSLIVAVLITLAIALAIVRPQLSDSVRRAGLQSARDSPRATVPQFANRTSVVLDSSWSMLAETSSGRTRQHSPAARIRT